MVLGERLQIYWVCGAQLRKLVELTFGYDPVFRNVDQSPFHGNEAGSAECCTLALKGASAQMRPQDAARAKAAALKSRSTKRVFRAATPRRGPCRRAGPRARSGSGASPREYS